MAVSSIYSDLRRYRYASSSEVDGETNYSYNKPTFYLENNKSSETEDNSSYKTNPKADSLEISDSAKKILFEFPKQNKKNEKESSTVFSTDTNQSLTEDEKKQVEELKSRDTEVKAHEAAHISAGGGIVRGGATFTYQSGPDGKQYAVGGEVNIDTSTVDGNPQATISKMQQVRRAALAPANPSSQDISVAQSATSLESQARIELSTKVLDNQKNEDEPIPEDSLEKQSNASENQTETKENPSNKTSNSDDFQLKLPLSNQYISQFIKSQKNSNNNLGSLINKTDFTPIFKKLNYIN